ncbi:hypothetical protein PoB_002561800 [Plakobranchus ocellatus]|uniref:Uncharacterized protein n=1 Tax=Plakobranchus ocellatus TaxID=259542 RepID=A0AAV3ZXH1_9GAST|nr:hypothetical protein PoB_002561800 [Plakobranchus ocellatus]
MAGSGAGDSAGRPGSVLSPRISRERPDCRDSSPWERALSRFVITAKSTNQTESIPHDMRSTFSPKNSLEVAQHRPTRNSTRIARRDDRLQEK